MGSKIQTGSILIVRYYNSEQIGNTLYSQTVI